MKCSICGKEIDQSHYRDEIPPLCENRTCYEDYFWQEKIKKFAENKEWSNNVAIVDGTHYHFSEEIKDSFFKGHGGTQFKIVFDDGRVVQTKNLWCQGDIPSRYREQLPDNAVFVESDESKENKIKCNNLKRKFLHTS